MALTKAQLIDLNGNELILDLDADTSITADTDDQIDIKIAGADDFRFTANTFTALSGSTIAAQALTATSITSTGNIVIPNAGTIGSASDADSIAISSAGVVTFSQSPVFPDGSLAVVDLDIDGATDIGAAIVDADLFIIDDGAGGTNRKVTASRIKTYIGATTAADDLTIGDAAILLTTSSGNITIDAAGNDTDIIFKGTDGNADTVYMTIDGSAGGDLFLTGGLIDLKNDGSAVSQIKFYCESSNAHAQTLIGAPHSQSATNTLTLPDGSNGVLLSTVSTATVTNKTFTSPKINEDVAVTSTATELNILDGVTTTTAEINLIDGGTSRGTTAVATGDGILINDGGTMRMTNVDTVSTYFSSHNVGGGNIVTTGALGSGSIAAGFGAIDNGTSGIRTNTFTAETSFVPDAQDGAALGTTSLQFSDLFLADGAVIGMGDDNEVTLTHVADTGVLLNGANVIQLRDSAINIGSPADGDLDINADDEIELNSTLIDINGNVEISGTAVTTGVHTFTAVPVFPNNTIETADIQADAIDGTKIADDAINSEHYTDGSIDTAHIGADQITNAKIADDQIDSEHYVDGSIDTAHIADGQVTTAKLATAVFTGATDIGADIADADLFLMDDGAGGTIRKTAASRLKTYTEGTFVLITEVDTSGSTTTVSIDNCFTSTYRNYFITLEDLSISNSSSKLQFGFRTGGGSGSAGGNNMGGALQGYLGDDSAITETAVNVGVVTIQTPSYQDDDFALQMWVFSPQAASERSTISGRAVYREGSTSNVGFNDFGFMSISTETHTGFTIKSNSAQLNGGGKIKVYGIK